MSFPAEQLVQGSPFGHLAECQQTISEIREQNPATSINLEVLAIFCVDAILTNYVPILRLISENSKPDEQPDNLEEATLTGLSDIAGAALLRVVEQTTPEPLGNLKHTVVEAVRENDTERLREILRICHKASQPIDPQEQDYSRVGKLSATILVASYGITRQM